VALDIFTDALDGLGPRVITANHFPLVEAEFDHLPFRSSSFDLAILTPPCITQPITGEP
jgi:ubiquinone/menaquinone biosynthesis C-methylase UbiE